MIFNFSQLQIKRIADSLITQEWVDNYNRDYEDDEDNFYTLEKIKSAIYELISFISFRDGKLILYRKILLNDVSSLDPNNIGCSWSFEKNPKMYHYHKLNIGDELVFSSFFNINDIDWDSTFCIWLIFYSNHLNSRENEIKVKCFVNINKLYLITNNFAKEIFGKFNTGKFKTEYERD